MFPSYVYVPRQLTLSAFTHFHIHPQGHKAHMPSSLSFNYKATGTEFPWTLFVLWGPLEDVCSLEHVAPARQVAWDPLTYNLTCHVHIHMYVYMCHRCPQEFLGQESPGSSLYLKSLVTQRWVCCPAQNWKWSSIYIVRVLPTCTCISDKISTIAYVLHACVCVHK